MLTITASLPAFIFANASSILVQNYVIFVIYMLQADAVLSGEYID